MPIESPQVEARAPAATRAGKGRGWLIPAFLLLLYVGQCLWFVGTQSLTFDEPIHMLTGVEAWHGRFNVWNDHPPLARLLFGLPLLAARFEVSYTGKSPGVMHVHGMRPGPESAAWMTRPLNVCLGVLLGVLLWTTARRMFSPAAANFALALFALSPGMIAHFSVATTDGAGILMMFAAAAAVARWREAPSRGNTVLLGVVIGLLLLAKFYTVPLAALAVALVMTWRVPKRAKPARLGHPSYVWRPRDWNWRDAAVVVVIALVLVSAAYQFHLTRLRVRDGVLTAFIPGRELAIVSWLGSPVDFTLWVPAGEYGDGLRYVGWHNALGHQNYLLGEISRTGWLHYYPVVAALKWPVIVLALFGASVVLALRRRKALPRDALVFAAFPLLFAALTLGSHIQIGDRHALPVYPFLLLATAAVWHWIASAKRGRAVLVVLLLLQAADTLRFAPDYLGYFNFWVRPAEAYKLVSDSNVDWGQGLIALRAWQQRHPAEPLALAYFGSVDPEVYGIRAQRLRPGERVSGKVAVSLSAMTGQYLDDPTAYRWLLQYPREMVNRSIFVFEVPESRVSSRFANGWRP